MANSSEQERKRSRDRELGMHRDITRRDFLNGMAIAAGGALASTWLPGSLAAQTSARRAGRTWLLSTGLDWNARQSSGSF